MNDLSLDALFSLARQLAKRGSIDFFHQLQVRLGLISYFVDREGIDHPKVWELLARTDRMIEEKIDTDDERESLHRCCLELLDHGNLMPLNSLVWLTYRHQWTSIKNILFNLEGPGFFSKFPELFWKRACWLLEGFAGPLDRDWELGSHLVCFNRGHVLCRYPAHQVLTQEVQQLLEVIWRERRKDFSFCPLLLQALADALEEQGVDHSDLLLSLRGLSICLNCQGTGWSDYSRSDGWCRHCSPDNSSFRPGWLFTGVARYRGFWVVDLLRNNRFAMEEVGE